MSRNLTPTAETARYIDSLRPEALAKTQAYTTGNHWLLLAGLLVSLLTAWLLVRTGLLDKLAARLSGKSSAISGATPFCFR